jgi:hypothetical protein
MRELTGEEEDEASCEASGVKERDHKTMPPAMPSELCVDISEPGPTFV